MDFLIKHWAAFPRSYPCGVPLGTSDYLVNKREAVDRKFETCNFSIILRGGGFFEREGRRYEVRAPAVITQWPGERPHYGPSGGGWDEWYLLYHRRTFRAFQARGFIDADRPVWPVADIASVTKCLQEFTALTRMPNPARFADIADRIAERAILSSLLLPVFSDREEEALSAVAGEMRSAPGRAWDFDALAHDLGYSVPTFRRRWREAFGRPPGVFLAGLRIAAACQLLAETRLRVKEVAVAVGFDDELYFSRRFRALVGESPRAYRAAYRFPG